jgi:hypothetical protein
MTKPRLDTPAWNDRGHRPWPDQSGINMQEASLYQPKDSGMSPFFDVLSKSRKQLLQSPSPVEQHFIEAVQEVKKLEKSQPRSARRRGTREKDV